MVVDNVGADKSTVNPLITISHHGQPSQSTLDRSFLTPCTSCQTSSVSGASYPSSRSRLSFDIGTAIPPQIARIRLPAQTKQPQTHSLTATYIASDGAGRLFACHTALVDWKDASWPDHKLHPDVAIPERRYSKSCKKETSYDLSHKQRACCASTAVSRLQ